MDIMDSSLSKCLREKPTIANFDGNCLFTYKFKIAGSTFLPARSPVIPKIINVVGNIYAFYLKYHYFALKSFIILPSESSMTLSVKDA